MDFSFREHFENPSCMYLILLSQLCLLHLMMNTLRDAVGCTAPAVMEHESSVAHSAAASVVMVTDKARQPGRIVIRFRCLSFIYDLARILFTPHRSTDKIETSHRKFVFKKNTRSKLKEE